MSEKPKRKHGPIRYIWHRARSHPIPFSYEVEESLEHVVNVMRGFRSETSYFVIDETPSPNLKEYHFTLKAGDDAVGRVFQISETTCAIEGTITLILWPLYVSVGMTFLGIASVFPTPGEFCFGLPLLLIGLYGLYSFRPRIKYDDILRLLETAARTIEETPPLPQPLQKTNHPSTPKHSRPSDAAAHDDKQEKRKR